MRWIICHMPLVLVVVMNLISCINKPEEYEPDIRIAFDAVIDAPTKADHNDHIYPKEVPFRLWVYELSDARKWDGHKSSATGIITGDKVIYNGKDWSTITEYLWPCRPNQLNFFAYSPANTAALFAPEEGVIFSNFNLYANADFLCSLPVTDASKPDTDALTEIIFKSPLCEIGFQAYGAAPDGTEIWIDEIVLKDMKCEGKFTSLPQWRWSELSESREIVVFKGQHKLNDTLILIGEKIKIIPQGLSPYLKYSYKDPYSDAIVPIGVELDMNDMPLPSPGKNREYIIKVTPEYAQVQNPQKLK